MTNKVDLVIAGSGAIGLAVARAASEIRGLEMLVIEKCSKPGTQTSSRNSGVIHAGLYYPRNSLKKKFCISGKKMLFEYLSTNNIQINKCGKFVVATSKEDLIALNEIKAKSELNGVIGIKELSGEEVSKLEPNVNCLRALWSPETSVFDVYSYITALSNECEEKGVTFAYNCEILNARKEKNNGDSFLVNTSHGDVLCKYLINCSGLNAPEFASKIYDYPKKMVPTMYFAKGNYFYLKNKKPFNRLIYPIPSKAGLGIHATLDIEGNIRFGPDVEWISSTSFTNITNPNDPYLFESVPDFSKNGTYEVDHQLVEKFYNAIIKYYPSISIDDLTPDYSGIRPKLIGPIENNYFNPGNRNLNDFIIEDFTDHGVPGLINLFGIESPGLTSSLSIAEYVVSKLLIKND